MCAGVWVIGLVLMAMIFCLCDVFGVVRMGKTLTVKCIRSSVLPLVYNRGGPRGPMISSGNHFTVGFFLVKPLLWY